VAAEDLAGGSVADGGGGGVEEDQYGCSAVTGADAEVVHAAGSTDGHGAVLVDVVEADPEVFVDAGAAREGFRGGLEGGVRGEAAEGAVRPAGVVDLLEGVELGL
jgi:hypothetical protein